MTSQRQTTLFEDAQLDADKLANEYDDECQWLVALSDWEITVILSLLRYAEWPSRWVLGSHSWDEISAKISGLEYCLMAGCNVSELIDKFDTLNGYMLTLASRFVTPEGANIAEVTEDQVLSAVCSPDVNLTVQGGGGCCGGGEGKIVDPPPREYYRRNTSTRHAAHNRSNKYPKMQSHKLLDRQHRKRHTRF